MFRISVLQGGIALREHLLAYPECGPDDAIRQLENGPLTQGRYDYASAREIACLHGWNVFSPDESRFPGLRHTINALAKAAKPFWARMAILGREKVRQLLDSDQEQCLKYAGLLETPIDDVSLQWWDDLARFFREQQQERLNEIGRKAESLTLAYERERLAALGISRNPIWLSPEDNTLGYDVMSFRKKDDDEIHPIYIEVKGSTATPIRFVLTRNEWKQATGFGERYYLYLWDLRTERLRVFPFAVLNRHIPTDNGIGKWMNTECAFVGEMTADQGTTS